jgi:hypothetical protein
MDSGFSTFWKKGCRAVIEPDLSCHSAWLFVSFSISGWTQRSTFLVFLDGHFLLAEFIQFLLFYFRIMKWISQNWWILFIKFGNDNIVEQDNYLWLYQICIFGEFGMVSALYEDRNQDWRWNMNRRK